MECFSSNHEDTFEPLQQPLFEPITMGTAMTWFKHQQTKHCIKIGRQSALFLSYISTFAELTPYQAENMWVSIHRFRPLQLKHGFHNKYFGGTQFQFKWKAGKNLSIFLLLILRFSPRHPSLILAFLPITIHLRPKPRN